jgi:CHAD domain-containing protein
MKEMNSIMNAWIREQSVFLENHAIIRQSPTKDAVHDLRVSIKKLRSYLTLDRKNDGEDHRENFATVKQLFRITGKFRDLQVCLSHIEKFKTDLPTLSATLANYFGSMLGTTQSWVRREAKSFHTGTLATLGEQLSKGIGNETKARLRAHICEQVCFNLRGMQDITASNFHEARKRGKEVLYWSDAAPSPQIFSKKERKDLERMLDLLGKKQDGLVVLKNLERFRKQWIVQGSRAAGELKIMMDEIKKKGEEFFAEAMKVKLSKTVK